MRNREEMREYMHRYRFNQVLNRWREQGKKCKYCDEILETIHHIDEDHTNDRLSNYLPVCQEHHLQILHKSDISDISPQNTPILAPCKTKKTVTLPKTIEDILQNCNNERVYNLTLRKSIGCNKTIHIIEGSRHLVEFLGSLGFTEVV